MESFFKHPRFESTALIFILSLLGVNAALTAVAGFSLISLILTVPLCAVATYFAPRAGLTAAVITTVLFERFFTLEPITWGTHLIKLYPIDFIVVAIFLALGVKYLQQGKKLFAWKKGTRCLVYFFCG